MMRDEMIAQKKLIREQQRANAILEQQRLADLRSKIDNANMVAPVVSVQPLQSIIEPVIEPNVIEPFIESNNIPDVVTIPITEPVSDVNEVINQVDADFIEEPEMSPILAETEPVEVCDIPEDDIIIEKPKRVTVKAKKQASVSRKTVSHTSDERKMVRNVHPCAIEMARREFPMANNIGDAISAYMIAHMDERPVVSDDLKQLIDVYSEDTVTTKLYDDIKELNAKVVRMDTTLRASVSVLQELQLGISYLIVDRKGFTREMANITLGSGSINLLEDCVPAMMARLHEQTRQYLNLQRLSEGRPKK